MSYETSPPERGDPGGPPTAEEHRNAANELWVQGDEKDAGIHEDLAEPDESGIEDSLIGVKPWELGGQRDTDTVDSEVQEPARRGGEVQVYASAQDASDAAVAPLHQFAEHLAKMDLPGKDGLLTELRTAEREVKERAAERYRIIEAQVRAEKEAELARRKQEEQETNQRREAVLRHVVRKFIGFLKGDEFMAGHQYERIELLVIKYPSEDNKKVYVEARRRAGEPNYKVLLEGPLLPEQVDSLVNDVYIAFGAERPPDHATDYKARGVGIYWSEVETPVLDIPGYYLYETRKRVESEYGSTEQQSIEDLRNVPLVFVTIGLGNKNFRIAPATAEIPEAVDQTS